MVSPRHFGTYYGSLAHFLGRFSEIQSIVGGIMAALHISWGHFGSSKPFFWCIIAALHIFVGHFGSSKQFLGSLWQPYTFPGKVLIAPRHFWGLYGSSAHVLRGFMVAPRHFWGRYGSSTHFLGPSGSSKQFWGLWHHGGGVSTIPSARHWELHDSPRHRAVAMATSLRQVPRQQSTQSLLMRPVIMGPTNSSASPSLSRGG